MALLRLLGLEHARRRKLPKELNHPVQKRVEAAVLRGADGEGLVAHRLKRLLEALDLAVLVDEVAFVEHHQLGAALRLAVPGQLLVDDAEILHGVAPLAAGGVHHVEQ